MGSSGYFQLVLIADHHPGTFLCGGQTLRKALVARLQTLRKTLVARLVCSTQISTALAWHKHPNSRSGTQGLL